MQCFTCSLLSCGISAIDLRKYQVMLISESVSFTLLLFLAAATGFRVGRLFVWGEGGVFLSLFSKFCFIVCIVSLFLYYHLCATAIIHSVKPRQMLYSLSLMPSCGRGWAGAFIEATFPLTPSIPS